jgi:large subunit ribosomal protein L25
MHFEFTAFPRGTDGRGANRRLRRSGRAPGIVYGGPGEPQTIELDHNALIHALENEAFHASILTMRLGEATQPVLLRAVQMHTFKKEVLHVDFQRVEASRRIRMKVPLHFTNGENAPAVKLAGAIISHVLTELDVSCLPKDLPEFIEVDLSELALNQSIHVSDLKLPGGVAPVAHAGLDSVVATAVIPKVIVEAEEVPAEGEAEAAAPMEEAAAPAGTEKAPEKGAEKTADKAPDKGAEKGGGKKEEKK